MGRRAALECHRMAESPRCHRCARHGFHHGLQGLCDRFARSESSRCSQNQPVNRQLPSRRPAPQLQVPPVAPPQHHAATPSLSLMFAPELSAAPIVLRPSRNCRMTGGTAGAVKPASPKGRSEAEWLDRAEDRRTISRREAALLRQRCSAREDTRRTGRAGFGKGRQVTA